MAEEQAQATLRETLVEAVANAQEPATPEVVAAPVVPEGETEAQRVERVRDEQGRFAKADKTTQAPVGAEAGALTPATPETPATEIPKPPSSWKKEMWPVWEKLHTGGALTPEEAKNLAQYNQQRESQFATGVSTYKQIADSAKPLLDAIAPYQADLDRHHISAPQLISSFAHAHKMLSLGTQLEKLQFAGKLLHDYRIPVQALYDQQAQQQFLATPHTPQLTQPQPNIQELVRQELAAARTEESILQEIQSMENDATKYPFFPYVRPTMKQLLETGEATDLNDAYSKALDCPEHARLVALSQKQQEQTEAQRKSEAAQAAARVARSNAVSPKSATPLGAPVNDKKDVRSALRDAIAQHAGGARV